MNEVIEEKDYEHEKHNNDVLVSKTIVEYYQEADGEEGFETLTLSTETNGVASYIIMKTTKWSIDSNDALNNILTDFIKRSGIPKI